MRNFNFDETEKKKINTNVIEEGEATGHFHRANVDIYESVEDNCMLLRVLEKTPMTHEEHNEIELFPGNYKKKIVCEYDHLKKETRRVID